MAQDPSIPVFGINEAGNSAIVEWNFSTLSKHLECSRLFYFLQNSSLKAKSDEGNHRAVGHFEFPLTAMTAIRGSFAVPRKGNLYKSFRCIDR